MQSKSLSVPILRKCVIAAVVLTAAVRLCAFGQVQSTQKQAPRRFTLATARYNFLIASGFLCEDADGCPIVAQAGDGETIEISGAGTLNSADKSVTAAGAFTQRNSAGAIASTGVWTATGLVSFESYGIAPFALLRDYPQLRTAGLFAVGGPMMMPGPLGALMSGPLAAGGLAVIRIRLLPDAGTPEDALLRVNCARGKVPEAEQTDSVKLTVTGGPRFDLRVSGRTVFLLQRPLPNLAWKSKTTVADGK